jgi:23S rRNA (pseudouridine1915-N3)-methyltransferase
VRLLLIAVGRMKSGPERELAERYARRFAQGARAVGLAGPRVVEIAESPARNPAERMAQEARAILAERPAGAALLVLDERGRAESSAALAARIAGLRDAGLRDLALVIGGANGLDPSLRAEATAVLSFGAMTMPHQLVRVLALEQLYRVTTILAGHPYHRE